MPFAGSIRPGLETASEITNTLVAGAIHRHLRAALKAIEGIHDTPKVVQEALVMAIRFFEGFGKNTTVRPKVPAQLATPPSPLPMSPFRVPATSMTSYPLPARPDPEVMPSYAVVKLPGNTAQEKVLLRHGHGSPSPTSPPGQVLQTSEYVPPHRRWTLKSPPISTFGPTLGPKSPLLAATAPSQPVIPASDHLLDSPVPSLASLQPSALTIVAAQNAMAGHTTSREKSPQPSAQERSTSPEWVNAGPVRPSKPLSTENFRDLFAKPTEDSTSTKTPKAAVCATPKSHISRPHTRPRGHLKTFMQRPRASDQHPTSSRRYHPLPHRGPQMADNDWTTWAKETPAREAAERKEAKAALSENPFQGPDIILKTIYRKRKVKPTM